MRLVVLAVIVVFVLGACASDPYPLPSGPPNATQRNSAAVGRPTNAVLIYLEVRPGDEIELIGAEAVGNIDGATVRFLVSRPVFDLDGSYVIGEEFEPLEGAIAAATAAVRDPRNTIGIAAELTATDARRFVIENVRLRYRLNGRPERVGEGIDVVWTVCADDPAPAECPDE